MGVLSSFIAANAIPAKLIADREVCEQVMNRKIPPIHLQLTPTNKCNLNCDFCSCRNRSKNEEMEFSLFLKLVEKFVKLGTKAVTLTGGGEPTEHPEFCEMVRYLHGRGLDLGMATNGINLARLDLEAIKKLTWCRISLSDNNIRIIESFGKVVNTGKVDWGFSYVLTKKTQINDLLRMVKYANEHDFTHVRIVDDIVDPGDWDMDDLRTELSAKMDDRLVVYQGRKTYSSGREKCLLSLLKPFVDPGGNTLPCCGIQYSSEVPSLDFGRDFIMGGLEKIDTIYDQQRYFNGGVCSKCYYDDYNQVLNMLWDSRKLTHRNFI